MATDDKFHAGHRQRLTQKFLSGKVTHYELLELMLTFSIPRRDVRPLSRLLLKTFGSYNQVLTAPIARLMEIPGVGPRTVTLIKLAQESGILQCQERLDSLPIFHDDKTLANYCKLMVGGKRVEEFHVLYLDKKFRLIADDLHTIGTIDYATIYPREILARALYLNAHSVFVYHNHPHESTWFSSDDVECTMAIIKKLSENDIHFYDHYVVSGTMVHSMRNAGLLNHSQNS